MVVSPPCQALWCPHRENFLVLDIFFEALNYEAIEQKKAYDLAGLLGDSPHLSLGSRGAELWVPAQEGIGLVGEGPHGAGVSCSLAEGWHAAGRPLSHMSPAPSVLLPLCPAVRQSWHCLQLCWPTLGSQQTAQQLPVTISPSSSPGDIGGQMGLFIGASILTILEILDYVYEVH